MAKIIIKKIEPSIGLPGGSVKIHGKGFSPWQITNKNISFSYQPPWIEGVSDTLIITTIPPKILSGPIDIEIDGIRSNSVNFTVPETIANGLHIVDNPIVDKDGNLYATYSGARGESTQVSLYKFTPYGEKIVYLKGLTNATSLAIDKDNVLYIASRFNGKIYKSVEEQEYELYTQGLGVAFGLAFNSKGELFAGDRSGSIFKINKDGIADYFTSIPQSYISFHLAFDSKDRLYASNPTHIGENFIYRIDEKGNVEPFYSGYSMFHGFCFDKNDLMYIAEAKRHESRITRLKIDTNELDVIMTGANFVGVCFDNNDNLLAASSNAIYLVDKKYLAQEKNQ